MPDPVDVEKVMADLRVKYPTPAFELRAVTLRMGTFVLRNPSHAEHQMFKRQVIDEESRHVASENLFVNTCVYPETAIVQATMQRYPGFIANRAVQKVMSYLSGSTDEIEGKG